MAKSQTDTSKGLLFREKEPGLYNVIMHNDDVTTMDFVVHILMTIFRKSAQDAEELMLKVDREGAAIVGTYHHDIALSKREKATREARQNGFPLLLTVEEEK